MLDGTTFVIASNGCISRVIMFLGVHVRNRIVTPVINCKELKTTVKIQCDMRKLPKDWVATAKNQHVRHTKIDILPLKHGFILTVYGVHEDECDVYKLD